MPFLRAALRSLGEHDVPRKVDLEAKLLADQERLRAERAKLHTAEIEMARRIQQERYRKQRAWEAHVGRLAWNAGFKEVFQDDLSAIEKLFAKLTPSDLFGGTPVAPLGSDTALEATNSL
jgi:hypothetical protein